MRLTFRIACCLLLVAGAVFAQGDRGTITGKITDPAGAVIPGASIEAKNNETGALYKVQSTDTGNYTLPQLPAGSYQLSVTVPGFKQYIRSGLTVLVAQVLRIDIALEVGNISETVTVSADAPLLRTESGELSHNITGDRLNSLPVEGFSVTIRDPYSVTQLIPGTLYQDRVYVRVNGAPANTQALRVEGQDASNGFFQSSTPQSQPSVEAIEEFSIQTSNYAPEFGQAGGGFFNVTMKSGSNAFHGSVFEYWSNEAFNANQPFVNIRQPLRAHDYGFTIGGPVWIPKVYDGHDRTFFFVSFERYPNNVTNTNLQLVPTLAYRNGDFRQALTGRVLGKDPLGRDIVEGTIYDPQTERLVNGLRVRDPFKDNTIPLDRFDPVAAKIQDLIPLPTSPDLVNNYFHPWLAPFLMTIPAFKVDHNLSARSKLSFYFSKTGQLAREQLGFSGGDGVDTPVTTSMPQDVQAYTTRLNFDQTLTPTMMLHLGAGLQGLKFTDQVHDPNFDQLKELGLPGSHATIFPNITGLSSARGGMKNMGPSAQQFSRMLKPTASASLTWVKSNHTYKFGAEMRIEGYPASLITPAYGVYNFSSEQTGLPSTLGQNLQGGTIGFPYASFLLGLVGNGNIGVIANTRVGKSAWALFAQDTWKVTPKFTLDYGLRWDYQTYFKEQYGRIPNFSPTTPNPSAGGLPGAVIFERDGVTFAKNYPYAFGPRLGAAYQILPKTVLRAGIGIMYSQTASLNQAQSKWGSTNPFYSPSFGDPAMLLQNGPPSPSPFPNLDPGQFPFPGTLSAPQVAIDRNAGRPPRMIQWSISIQHEIFKNLAIEAAYVGNRGAWWEGNSLLDVDALTPERIASFGLDINSAADRQLLASPLNSPLAAQRGFDTPPYAGFPMSSTVAQALRPFPQFAGTFGFGGLSPAINYLWAPLGRTWYDSMQLKLTKRFSYGLDFTSAFTWQKELMMGAEQSGGINLVVPAINDVFNTWQNKYLSGLSRPFISVTAFNYTLPRLGIHKVLSGAIRDWTLGASLTYASGMPFRVPTAQNQLSTALFRSTFAERVPGEPLFTVDLNCHCYDPSTTFVLNPNAWVDPPAGQYASGPAYFNDYRQQRRPLENFTVGRIFRIKEHVSLNIRADFQNIFNRAFWPNPDSSNAKATQTKNPVTGMTISGFGRVNTLQSTAILGRTPRQGMLVARLVF